MKNRILLPLLALVVLSGLVAPTAARAVLITIDFSFLTTESASGSFSFDSSVLPSPGGTVTGAALSSLSFAFDGKTFTTSDTSLNLHTNADGSFLWSFYSIPSTLAVAPGFVLDGLPIGSPPAGGAIEATTWTIANQVHGDLGSGSFSIASSPEPGTIALLGLGLLPLGMILKRKK